MGQVRTIFANAKVFWQGMEAHIKEIVSNGDIVAALSEVSKEDFVDQLKTSGLDWLALAKINYKSSEDMKKASKNVDGILEDIPDREQAAKLISTLSEDILIQLHKEEANINKASDKLKKIETK